MDFNLTFVVDKKSSGRLYRVDSTWFGLEELDKIRADLKVPHLDPGLVDNYVPRFSGIQHRVTLSEKEARTAGCFAESSGAVVQCNAEKLTPLIRSEYYTQRDPEKDTIIEVKKRYHIDDEELIAAWLQAGAPLKWGVGV